MAEGYTDADVQAAADVMAAGFREYTGTPAGQNMWNLDMERTFRIAADALAAAGRLLPPEAETRTEWATKIVDNGHAQREEFLGDFGKNAPREIAAHRAQFWAKKGCETQLVRRDVITAVGPWREVTGDD